MIISCQRCSTVYELDESLLASEGSPVQCTRCQHVFTARPPGAKGETLVGVPAVSAAATAEPSAPVAAPPGSGTDVLPGAPQLTSQPVPARAPVPARGAPAPVYRPTPGAFAGAGPARSPPVVRKDAIGSFESRLRWSARLRWLVPAAGALVVTMGAAAWWFSRTPSGDPAPEPERAAVQTAPRREAPAPASPLPEPPPVAPPAAAVPAVYVVPSAAGEGPAAPRNESSQTAEPADAAAPAALPEPAPRPVRRSLGVLAPATIPALDATSALPVIEPPAAVVRSARPSAAAPEPATEQLEPPPSPGGG